MEERPSYEARFRRRLRRQETNEDDDNVSELSWSSRPTTRDSYNYATSGRVSTDSGAGSLEDFRRGTTPLPTTFLDFWDGVRRHTAPPRKLNVQQSADDTRPNTVHAWNMFPSRSTMSKYTPLPSIGIRSHNTVPRYCFQDTDDQYEPPVNDLSQTDYEDAEDVETPDDDENVIFRRSVPKVTSTLTSLSIESEFDSDFDEDTESCILYASEDEEDEKVRRPLVRSATFTIEDRKPLATLLLAVRLPDGSRVSGQFSAMDTLRNVCETALRSYKDTIDEYELVTTEIPRRIFSDFSMSLQAAGIANKTLLNLQVCSDED